MQADSQSKRPTTLRLFCFPHAGGNSTSFQQWQKYFPSHICVHPIELPGRQTRITEPPIDRLTDLLPCLMREMEPYLDAPFALFGHSMGALIAFEMARNLRRSNRCQPRHLFVSGYPAPHLAGLFAHPRSMPEPLLLRRAFPNLPAEVLRNNELKELILPVLRADFSVCATYKYVQEPPFEFPITACGGTLDGGVRRYHLN